MKPERRYVPTAAITIDPDGLDEVLKEPVEVPLYVALGAKRKEAAPRPPAPKDRRAKRGR